MYDIESIEERFMREYDFIVNAQFEEDDREHEKLAQKANKKR
jgi:hypothetical protein